MAGKTKEMSLIKQVLLLKQTGESNRGVARELPIDKGTVNTYMRLVESNKWQTDDLLKIDDPVLDRMFHAGSPAFFTTSVSFKNRENSIQKITFSL